MNYRICVIGTEALIFPFLQFGFATYTPSSEADLRQYLLRAIDQGFGIIYMEDAYCFQVKDILDQYETQLTPVIIPIGVSEEGESYHQQMIREMMEQAIGLHVI